jgi:hypothetical protein
MDASCGQPTLAFAATANQGKSQGNRVESRRAEIGPLTNFNRKLYRVGRTVEPRKGFCAEKLAYSEFRLFMYLELRTRTKELVVVYGPNDNFPSLDF